MKHTGTVTIQTKRLTLRRFAEEDAPAVFANYGSDPKVNEYITFAPCQTMEGTEGFIRMHLERYDREASFYGWAMELNGQIIGSIGAFDVDEDMGSAELGCSLGSAYWGHGLAAEAVSAVLAHLFDTVGMRRVFASHHEDNIGSGRVMQKAGMIYEGTARKATRGRDGVYKDLKFYSILRTDERPVL